MKQTHIKGITKIVVTDSTGVEHSFDGTGEGYLRVSQTNDGAKPVPKKFWHTATAHIVLKEK